MTSRSLVVDSDDETLSDISDNDYECPDVLPPPVKRNRDMDDLMWALCCRECAMAVDGEGYCACVRDEETENVPPPPKKRTLSGVVDLTSSKSITTWIGKK